MAETLALAVGVPAVLAAAWLASRRNWSPAHADSRGIALQTVIVIVVMLVIAGGVAGVLLSRGGEVMADLESQDINTTDVGSQQECTDAARALNSAFSASAGTVAVASTAENVASWASSSCTVNGSADVNNPNISQSFCERTYSGTYTAGTGTGTGGNAETCVIS